MILSADQDNPSPCTGVLASTLVVNLHLDSVYLMKNSHQRPESNSRVGRHHTDHHFWFTHMAIMP